MEPHEDDLDSLPTELHMGSTWLQKRYLPKLPQEMSIGAHIQAFRCPAVGASEPSNVSERH